MPKRDRNESERRGHRPECPQGVVPHNEHELEDSKKIQKRIDTLCEKIQEILASVPRVRGKTPRRVVADKYPEIQERLKKLDAELSTVSRRTRKTKKMPATTIVYPDAFHPKLRGNGKRVNTGR